MSAAHRSLGDKIRHGALWLFLGNTGSQILTFAFGIVLARLLTPQDFGTLVTVQVFTGLAGFVSGGGMGQGLVRAREASKDDYDAVFTLQLAIGCAIYAVFYFAAPWFARWYDTPLYASLLRVSALSFIIRPFINLPGSLMHRHMRFKEQTGSRITTLLISSGVSIAMAYHGFGVWSLVMGGMAGSLTSMVLLTNLSGWRPGLSLDFSRARELARYGFLVSANDIVVYLRNQATNFILGRTLGAHTVGLFNKADSLARMPSQMVTGPVYQVLFRALAQEHDDLDKSRYLFFRSISLVAVYVTPLYLCASWLAEPLVTLLYGPKWADCAAPLAILALAGPFMMIGQLCGAVLAARKWLGREFVVQVILLILTGAATLAGLDYGLTGIATALVFVAGYNATHMYALASRCLKARWKELLVALAPAAGLNAILAGVLFLTHLSLPATDGQPLLQIAAMMAAGTLVYAGCFLFLPLAALRSEQQRWKQRLRLSARPAP